MPVALLCASLMFAQATPVAAVPDPREQVATAVAYGIHLLETKEYARFLQEFVSPLETKQVLGTEPGAPVAPELAASFGKDKAPRVQQALRDAQNASPVFEDNNQTAIYSLRTPIGGRHAMAFTKVGKYWYIKN